MKFTELDNDYISMLFRAKSLINNDRHPVKGIDRVFVILSEKETVSFVVHAENVEEFFSICDEFIWELKLKKQSRVLKIVCLRFDKTAVTPSIHFLRTLCELNVDNRKTEILSDDGKENYKVRSISNHI